MKVFAVAAFVFTPALTVELLKPPPSANSEKGASIATTKSGAVRWRSEWTMEKSSLDGRKVVRFTERGSGLYSPFNREVRWNTESVWSVGEAFRPLTIEHAVTDSAGRVLLRERKLFQFDRGVVGIERRDRADGPASKSSLKIPSDTLTVDGLPAALRSLPFGSRPFQIHLLSNEPKLYPMSLEVRGRERVRTPAGDFECYKVELVPDLGALNLLRFAAPKVYFWFTVDPPHFWVRYEGPENGRGTPDIVVNLSSFERSGSN
jgi:hypothetical protein